jgi:hypothetical protein
MARKPIMCSSGAKAGRDERSRYGRGFGGPTAESRGQKAMLAVLPLVDMRSIFHSSLELWNC